VPGCAGLGRPAAEGRRARFMFRAYKKRGVASRAERAFEMWQRELRLVQRRRDITMASWSVGVV